MNVELKTVLDYLCGAHVKFTVSAGDQSAAVWVEARYLNNQVIRQLAVFGFELNNGQFYCHVKYGN